jgi:transcriptional regulator of arginine metabolism
MFMTKKIRQQVILDVVKAKNIFNLFGLLTEVKRQGCRVNVSTLSRDLTEIGIVKTRSGYRFLNDREQNPEIMPSRVATLQQMITGMQAVKNLVIIYTTTGGAQAVGRWLDLIPHSGLVGTVAGDDTILGITENNAKAQKFINKLSQTIENRKI